MTTREYDIEEIRDVGENACPAVAASYENLAGYSRRVTMDIEGCFGTHALTDTWFDLYKLLNTAIEESAISIDAMGDTLAAIADEYAGIESETEVSLESLVEDIESTYDQNRSVSEAEFQETAEPEPSGTQSNPYEAAL